MKRIISALGSIVVTVANIPTLFAGEPEEAAKPPASAAPVEGKPSTDQARESAEDLELDRLHDLVRRKEKEASLRERLAHVEERERTRIEARREREMPKKAELPWAHRGRFLFSEVAGLRVGSGSDAEVSGLFAFRSLSTQGASPMRETSFSFRPSVDEFISDRVTLGGALEVGRTTSDWGGTTGSGFRLGAVPRVGLVTPIGPGALFWRIGVGTTLKREDFEVPNGVGAAKMVSLDLVGAASVDAIFPLHRYVFLAIGPELLMKHTFVDTTDGSGALGSPGEGDLIRLAVRASIGLTLP